MWKTHFWREHLCDLCALLVFLCALVSQPICTHTRAQLRGNIGCDPQILGWGVAGGDMGAANGSGNIIIPYILQKVPRCDSRHVLKKHLPPPKVHKYNLRMRPHNLTLPPKDDRNFIARQLYKNIY